MTLRPADRVEHFVVVSLLGEGGMGQVYHARDTRLQRGVALKIVRPEPSGGRAGQSSGGAARLLREAQAAAALQHPNVVTIYEVGEVTGPSEAAGSPYIAMELVRGRTLREYEDEAKTAIHERIRWLRDIARALAAAHDAGLVHRDLKPANVMIRDDGVVKVLDFGLAKRAAGPVSSTSSTEADLLPNVTVAGVAVGTPLYMSPEQMRREALDGRSDQFSWGVVAYELLSGRSPWGADLDALELVSKILTEQPAPLEEVCPDVPRTVSRVVARAISKARADRFPTMNELVEVLERGDDPVAPVDSAGRAAVAAVGEGSPPPSGAVTPPRPRPFRSRVVAFGVGASLAALGLLGWGARAVLGHGPSGSPSMRAEAAAPTTGPPPECTRNTECVDRAGGKPAACNAARRCVPIENAQCRALIEPGDLRRDDLVWVGAMFPLTGEAAADYGRSNVNAVDLARTDFAQTLASLRDAPGGARPIGVVACDDARDPADAARHIVEDVGAPAVIGFHESAEAVDLANALLVPRGVLTVAALNMSPLIASIPHPRTNQRLVFRTTYSTTATARAIAEFVPRILEPAVHADLHGEPMRVANVSVKNATGMGFTDETLRSLRFNGRSAVDNGASYHEVAFDDRSDDAGAPDYAAIVDDLLRFRPHVVLFVGHAPAFRGIVLPLERRWPARVPRPTYVTISTLTEPMLHFIGKSAERRRRFFGLTTVSTTPNNARFVLHYNETFSDKITRTQAPNSSYDAFYLVAYAALALGSEPATGEALARAVKRLTPPGVPVNVGVSSILDGYGALRRGANIDLDGATGKLDFDVTTGEAPVDQAIVCARVDAAGTAIDSIESGLVFDDAMRELKGEMRCP